MGHIIIIGAGFTGLSAAYDLRKAGHTVEIFEADKDIGGLGGTFELSPGIRIEKFYHHWFSSDTHIIDWLREIGVGERITFRETNTGLFFANTIFRLKSPLDLLKFTPLPLIDRVRTGLMALIARKINNWKPLENETAIDWVKRYAGQRSYDVIWRPLFQGKFGHEAEHISAVWFWNKLKLRGSSRDAKGKEMLAYFKGSFGSALDSIRESLQKSGVTITVNTPVDEILTDRQKLVGVKVRNEVIKADRVLVTTPLPIYTKLFQNLPSDYVEKTKQIRFLGNVCMVLRLNRSLSSTYWLNVADPNFPYVGVIEHTNFDDKAHYNGEHIAYLSKYLPTSDKMYSMTTDQLVEYSLPYLKQMFPAFDRSWIVGAHSWRAEFSQPVITKHYSRLIPDEQTPIDGVWLSTMAQVYPEDRGTNYAVRHGRAVAKRIIESLR